MTAAHAAATNYVPSARAAQVAAAAICDGTGLIIVPTADGPETSACFGCRACTPIAVDPVRAEQRRAANLRDVFAAAPDDEAW